MTLKDVVENIEGYNCSSAWHDPKGGIVLMLHHRNTMDNAVLIYVPDDANVMSLDDERYDRINEGGSWLDS
jgi:hypothetical protein